MLRREQAARNLRHAGVSEGWAAVIEAYTHVGGASFDGPHGRVAQDVTSPQNDVRRPARSPREAGSPLAWREMTERTIGDGPHPIADAAEGAPDAAQNAPDAAQNAPDAPETTPDAPKTTVEKTSADERKTTAAETKPARARATKKATTAKSPKAKSPTGSARRVRKARPATDRNGAAGEGDEREAAANSKAAAEADPSVLLERVAELAALAERQQALLENEKAERDKLQVKLDKESQRLKAAEQQVTRLESNYSDVAAELVTEGAAREQAELDLARCEETAAVLERQMHLNWSRLKASEAQEAKRRWWRGNS